jgi:hypothetical protein
MSDFDNLYSSIIENYSATAQQATGDDPESLLINDVWGPFMETNFSRDYSEYDQNEKAEEIMDYLVNQLGANPDSQTITDATRSVQNLPETFFMHYAQAKGINVDRNRDDWEKQLKAAGQQAWSGQ